jgi:alanine racemase
MLYGCSPQDLAEPVGLRPAFRALKTRLIEAKDLTPRERFAEAAPFPIRRPMRLGVIPIGTGDGFHRLHAGRVLVRGRSVPILARPSLEHTRIDLTTVPDAAVGDEVVLIGRQGAAEIDVEEVARRHGADPFALALGIGPRVARVYLRGGVPHASSA